VRPPAQRSTPLSRHQAGRLPALRACQACKHAAVACAVLLDGRRLSFGGPPCCRRKKDREAKRFSKQVAAERKKERAAERKAAISNISKLRKQREKTVRRKWGACGRGRCCRALRELLQHAARSACHPRSRWRLSALPYASPRFAGTLPLPVLSLLPPAEDKPSSFCFLTPPFTTTPPPPPPGLCGRAGHGCGAGAAGRRRAQAAAAAPPRPAV
jgi:hypothetical protein